VPKTDGVHTVLFTLWFCCHDAWNVVGESVWGWSELFDLKWQHWIARFPLFDLGGWWMKTLEEKIYEMIYSRYPKSGCPITGNIWKPNIFVSCLRMVSHLVFRPFGNWNCFKQKRKFFFIIKWSSLEVWL
jgi:hypothetical protein